MTSSAAVIEIAGDMEIKLLQPEIEQACREYAEREFNAQALSIELAFARKGASKVNAEMVLKRNKQRAPIIEPALSNAEIKQIMGCTPITDPEPILPVIESPSPIEIDEYVQATLENPVAGADGDAFTQAVQAIQSPEVPDAAPEPEVDPEVVEESTEEQEDLFANAEPEPDAPAESNVNPFPAENAQEEPSIFG